MSNPRRHCYNATAFAGLAICLGAAAPAASASEVEARSSSPAEEILDCAVAAPRFGFNPRASTARPEIARAPGGARLRTLVALACSRGPVAREV